MNGMTKMKLLMTVFNDKQMTKKAVKRVLKKKRQMKKQVKKQQQQEQMMRPPMMMGYGHQQYGNVDSTMQKMQNLNQLLIDRFNNMTGCYDETILNQIRLRIQNRCLPQGSIEKICQEFHIHIKLPYIDDETTAKNKKQTNKTTKKDGSRKSYYGVAKDEAVDGRIHELTIYKNHYCIEEKTPFSTYYIKHLHEYESDESMFDKEKYH